jgi:hypothetical protein
MTKRIALRVNDGRMADMMITPETRITAEPAPEVGPGDMGALYTGDPGLPKQLALAQRAITETGLLSAADLAAVKAILQRYSGTPANATNRVGITGDSTDAVDEARAAVAHVRQGCERLQSINDRNRVFWDQRNAADEARILGR